MRGLVFTVAVGCGGGGAVEPVVPPKVTDSTSDSTSD